jgi:hypothetical protein
MINKKDLAPGIITPLLRLGPGSRVESTLEKQALNNVRENTFPGAPWLLWAGA